MSIHPESARQLNAPTQESLSRMAALRKLGAIALGLLSAKPQLPVARAMDWIPKAPQEGDCAGKFSRLALPHDNSQLAFLHDKQRFACDDPRHIYVRIPYSDVFSSMNVCESDSDCIGVKDGFLAKCPDEGPPVCVSSQDDQVRPGLELQCTLELKRKAIHIDNSGILGCN